MTSHGPNRAPAELIAALRDPRQRLFGTVLSTVDVVFAEIAASRFDLVWIDLEHSSLSLRDVQALVIASAAAGAFSLVRLDDADGGAVGAILDAGVDGVVLPRADDRHQVERLATKLCFPPQGTRGYAPRRKALISDPTGLQDRPACIVQIESRAGVEKAATIAAVEVCDALVVGTADLSFDLGTPMQFDDPKLAEAVTAVRDAATAAGKGWGVAGGGDHSLFRSLAEPAGATLVYGSDVRIFAEAIAESASNLRGAM